MSDDIVREFLVESSENLDLLDRELINLEKDPGNRGTLASIFRTIHTIKGTCGFLGFTKLESVAHVGENLLTSAWRLGLSGGIESHGWRVREASMADFAEGLPQQSQTLRARMAGQSVDQLVDHIVRYRAARLSAFVIVHAVLITRRGTGCQPSRGLPGTSSSSSLTIAANQP